jgi:hypothetical protein
VPAARKFPGLRCAPSGLRILISCGRAVDERDAALTQGAAIFQVNPEKSAVR